MKIFLSLFILMALAMPAHAAEKHEDVIAHVTGMVCDFCAQSVLKIFEDKAEITSIDVSLDDATVTFHQAPGASLSDEDIQDGIYYAGYDLEKIERMSVTH